MRKFDFDAPDCTCAYRFGNVARNMCGHTPPCPVYERWREETGLGRAQASEAETGSAVISVPLTDKEYYALEDLARSQELPRERVMIQALRLYQLVTVGGAKIVLPDEPPKYGPSPLAAHVGQALADVEMERDLRKTMGIE